MTDHKNLAGALAAVQAALPVVHKGKTASIKSDKGSYGYSYADLSDVTAAIMPLLSKHGLSFSCAPRLTDKGGYELVGVLMHVSGGQLEGALPLTGGTPQQLGSSITYMRRYLLGSMTGVVTDDDDDARLATQAAKEARREVHRQVAEESVPRISDTQSKRLHALCNDLGLDRDKKLAIAKWSAGRDITSSSDLTASEASALIDYLAGRLADQQRDSEAGVTA